MNHTTPNSVQPPLVLAEKRAFRHGLQMTYRLSLILGANGRAYLLSVASDTDICTEAVGGDLMHAAALYQAVSEGFVTPCTLSDVLADLNLQTIW